MRDNRKAGLGRSPDDRRPHPHRLQAGGGFHAHSIDSEGFDVARALVTKGVTGIVLKYRLIETKGADPVRELSTKSPQQFGEEVPPIVRLAAADGKAAVALVHFLLAATDDQLGLGPHSVRLYADWTAAKKPAELHLYSKGGHGFGMRKQDLPSDRWIDLFTDWLGVQGLLKK